MREEGPLRKTTKGWAQHAAHHCAREALPRAPGRSRLGRRSRVRPAPHTWRCHPEVKRAARKGNQTPTSRPVGRLSRPAPGRPPGAGDTGAHCRRPGAGVNASRRPPPNRQPALRPPAPPPARPGAPRALPPHLPPPGLSGRPTGTQGRGEARGASPPGRLSPVAGRGASRRASPRPRPAPPACHLRVARRRSRAPRGVGARAQCGARAARRPRSRPRARAGSEDCKGALRPCSLPAACDPAAAPRA